MDLNSFVYILKKNVLKPAIFHFEDENDFTCLSFKEAFDICNEIQTKISKILTSKWLCFGLLMDFNPFIPSIILSLLLSNHSFIFLNPNSSEYKLLEIIKKLKIKWIITMKKRDHKLENYLKYVVSLNNHLELNSVNLNYNDKGYEGIIYLVLTSGTTGEEKLVRVQHNCIFSNINTLRKIFNLKEEDVVYFGTPLTFDPSMVELFLALTTGSALISVSSKLKLNPPLLYKILFKENLLGGVTFLQTVPSLFCRWDSTIIKDIFQNSTLRILAFGGEKFPESLFTFKRSEKLRIFNLYGITEVSCWASLCELCDDNKATLGTPLDDTLLEVRDDDGKAITEGEGELFIGSYSRICLINEEDETIQRPVFRSTGDIVSINNNILTYITRKDDIIKHLGQKICLTKVEESVYQETGLVSVALWSEEKQQLLLFVEAKIIDYDMRKKVKDKLKRKLMHILSEELLPNDIEILSIFPTTKNGKINKKALLKMYKFFNLQNTSETALDIFKNLWAKSLGLDLENLEELREYNFFELGGTSFLFVQFLNEFKELSKNDMPKDLYNLILTESFQKCCDYFVNHEFELHKRKCKNDHPEAKIPKIIKLNDLIELKLKWSYDLRGCVYTTPLVTNYRQQLLTLCASFYQVFAAIDLETGQMVSEFALPDYIQGDICANDLGTAFIGCSDASMYCIDVFNGEKVWSFETGAAIKSRPCFCLEKQAIVFGSYDGCAYCLSSKDGTLLWKTKLGPSISTNPVYVEKYKCVYMSSTNSVCVCLTEKDGSILWKYEADATILGSPCTINCSGKDCILWPTVKGLIYCTTCAKGEKLWTFKADNSIYSSITAYQNFIFFGCWDHNIYCAIISNGNCSLYFKILLDSEITPTPYVFEYRNSTYIAAASNKGTLYVIDFEKRAIAQKIQMNDEIFCSPYVYNSNILVGCNNNHLYCFSIASRD